jgi:protein-tyrosine phosphatase
MLVQLTAASVDGRLGKRARDASFALLDLRLAHLLASDAHAPSIREVGLSAAVKALDDDELGSWLTEDVPAAIVFGSPVPDRPPAR